VIERSGTFGQGQTHPQTRLAPQLAEAGAGKGVRPLGSACPSRRVSWPFRPLTPRSRSGSSLNGVEGSTELGTLSLSKGSRTIMTNVH